MKTKENEKQLLLVIRLLTVFFIGALVVSGLTAFPLENEMRLVSGFLGVSEGTPVSDYSGLEAWFAYLYEGVRDTNTAYPFLAYGTDWLAFAHVVIAIAFVGVYRKPVRNVWIVYWAMIACVAVIPTVLICAPIRQIPFFWQLVDCSFGVFGIIPLLILRSYIMKLAVVSDYVEQRY